MPIPNIDSILGSNLQIGSTPIEAELAKAWLRAHWQDWDRVEIQPRLGPVPAGVATIPPPYNKSAAAGLRPRADLIAYRTAAAAIVECKERIYPAVLGQLLTYEHLLRDDNASLLQIYKIAVGVSVMPGVSDVLDKYGVTVELFAVSSPVVST